VFFLPFSATAVLNVGSTDAASGVQATIFFGTLWMARELPRMYRASDSSFKENLRAPGYQLGIFVIIVLLSLTMPLWSNGRIYIEDPDMFDPNPGPLQFTFRHITQTLYLVYGVSLSILVAYRNSELGEFIRSVRTFLISAIFVSIWGFFQLFCYFINIPYPSYIFNTGTAGSALGYLQELEDIGMKRISSVATEPSLFASCMLVALGFALFAVISKQPLISKMWDQFAVGIILGGLLFSTSSTAYVGLVVIFVLYLFALLYLRILTTRHIVFVLIFAILLGLVGAFSSTAQDLVASMVVGKSGTTSGIGRLYSVVLAAQYFIQYPVLGLGWGSVTSNDLIFKLLSNTGVLGFSAFSFFIISLVRRLWRERNAVEVGSPERSWWSACLLTAVLILIFTNLTTGFEFVYEHLWFVFGLAMAVPMLGSVVSFPQPSPDLGGRDLRGHEVIVR
jgi:O-antigen ligase